MSSTFHEALEQFEATEANLGKLERLCADIRNLVPPGIDFGANPEYEDKCRTAEDIANHLPMIGGWKPNFSFLDSGEIAQTRLDFLDLGEPSAEIAFETSLDEPQRQIRDYRFRFNRSRRTLVRSVLDNLIDTIDKILRDTSLIMDGDNSPPMIPDSPLSELRNHFKEILILLGSSAPKPERSHDMARHLHFGHAQDFSDIVNFDWPEVKVSLRKNFYGQDDPIPVKVADLGELVASNPKGPIPIMLKWSSLSDESFERLVFALIASERGYENPEWLMPTRASDRGRDLSVMRVSNDGLSGPLRNRVIIQCKHWLTKSVNVDEIAKLKEQMALWEPPRVDVMIIATSGRFSADAVQAIERHNQADRAMRIEMWPESHLEILLATRPALIAEYGLR